MSEPKKNNRGTNPRSLENLKQGGVGQPKLSDRRVGTLRAMRMVQSQPPSKDDTYQLRNFRSYLNDHPDKFYAKLFELEKRWLDRKERGKPVEAEADEPTVRIRELIERCLRPEGE